MNKKRNNKGFSLVELIVVIAVMAVLVVVLAPAYLRYVDKSRTQKDVSAVSEIVNAIKIAASEETVSNEIPADSTKAIEVIVTSEKDIYVTKAVKGTGTASEAINETSGKLVTTEGSTITALGKEIRATVGESIKLTSSNLKASTITIKVYQTDNHNIKVTVSDSVSTADATKATDWSTINGN